ncbi:unnamed protein product [Sphagnum tenellum]
MRNPELRKSFNDAIQAWMDKGYVERSAGKQNATLSSPTTCLSSRWSNQTETRQRSDLSLMGERNTTTSRSTMPYYLAQISSTYCQKSFYAFATSKFASWETYQKCSYKSS